MGFMKQMKDMKATVDGIEASAQVVAAGNPTGMLNTDPIVPVSCSSSKMGFRPDRCVDQWSITGREDWRGQPPVKPRTCPTASSRSS